MEIFVQELRDRGFCVDISNLNPVIIAEKRVYGMTTRFICHIYLPPPEETETETIELGLNNIELMNLNNFGRKIFGDSWDEYLIDSTLSYHENKREIRNMAQGMFINEF